MKRSEMIKVGREALQNLPRDLERGIKLSANDRYMITSILLGVIEEAGMLPPKSKEKVDRENELRMHGYFLDYNMPETYYHTWDEESGQ